MVCAECQKLQKKTELATPGVKRKNDIYLGSPTIDCKTSKSSATLGATGIGKVRNGAEGFVLHCQGWCAFIFVYAQSKLLSKAAKNPYGAYSNSCLTCKTKTEQGKTYCHKCAYKANCQSDSLYLFPQLGSKKSGLQINPLTTWFRRLKSMRNVRKIPEQGMFSSEWEATSRSGPEIFCEMKTPTRPVCLYIPQLDVSGPRLGKARLFWRLFDLTGTWSGRGGNQYQRKGKKKRKQINRQVCLSASGLSIRIKSRRIYELCIHFPLPTKLPNCQSMPSSSRA